MAISRAISELDYSALRPKQELAIRHFLRGSDMFVSFPTGSGKSFMLPFAIQGLRFSPSTYRVERIYSLKPFMPWTM